MTSWLISGRLHLVGGRFRFAWSESSGGLGRRTITSSSLVSRSPADDSSSGNSKSDAPKAVAEAASTLSAQEKRRLKLQNLTKFSVVSATPTRIGSMAVDKKHQQQQTLPKSVAEWIQAPSDIKPWPKPSDQGIVLASSIKGPIVSRIAKLINSQNVSQATEEIMQPLEQKPRPPSSFTNLIRDRIAHSRGQFILIQILD